MATKRAHEAEARARGGAGARRPSTDAVWNRHDRVLVQRLAGETGGERRAALRDLIDQARTDLDDYIAPYLAAVGGKRSGGGSSSPEVDRPVVAVERQTLGAYEENRGRAFSEGIARLAGDPAGENGRAVHAFRRVALGGAR